MEEEEEEKEEKRNKITHVVQITALTNDDTNDRTQQPNMIVKISVNLLISFHMVLLDWRHSLKL